MRDPESEVVVAIDPKEIYRFQVRVYEKKMQSAISARSHNQRFLLTLKKKISRNDHFIHNLNEYKFIYVPKSISGKKKIFIFDERCVLIFYPAKVSYENAF